MANIKTGLAYYNIDTDRYQDMRIKRLKKDFRCMGIAVYDYILCEIYRVRGCFIEWDESTAFDVAEYFDLKESQVKEIVNYCCALGLFSKERLVSGSILTSASIQKRYIEMCTRAKRKDIIIPEKCRIIQEESPKITEESLNITEFCDKVKKSKVKESKEEKEKLKKENINSFNFFISSFNSIRKSRFRATETVKRQFNARIDDGYTPEQMLQALENAMKAKNHIESGFSYLTPEFITRASKLELWLNSNNQTNANQSGARISDAKRRELETDMRFAEYAANAFGKSVTGL